MHPKFGITNVSQALSEAFETSNLGDGKQTIHDPRGTIGVGRRLLQEHKVVKVKWSVFVGPHAIPKIGRKPSIENRIRRRVSVKEDENEKQ